MSIRTVLNKIFLILSVFNNLMRFFFFNSFEIYFFFLLLPSQTAAFAKPSWYRNMVLGWQAQGFSSPSPSAGVRVMSLLPGPCSGLQPAAGGIKEKRLLASLSLEWLPRMSQERRVGQRAGGSQINQRSEGH